MLAIGVAAALAGCVRDPAQIRGKLLSEEIVSLQRGEAGDLDSAERQISATPGSSIVVFVAENGTDVLVTLLGEGPALAVENSQKGEGLEIVTALVPSSGKLQLSLHGPQNADRPGSVALRVEEFTAAQLQEPAFRDRLAGYRAWMRATSDMTRERVESGSVEIDKAIDVLESSNAGDRALAAKARAVRARMFYEFEVSWREASEEAARAAAAFAAPGVADALNEARARRLQAAALQEVAASRRESPAARRAADLEARRIYAGLLMKESALDTVGRGRVHNDLGIMDVAANQLDSAAKHYAAAIEQYRSVGFGSGVRQTARNLGGWAVRRGDYLTASQAFAAEIAYLPKMPPDARATLLINAAIADINIGATDRAIDRLGQAIDIAKLGGLEPALMRAMRTLGIAYWSRGDTVQAAEFLEQVIEKQKLMDEAGELAVTLRVRGALLRDAGNASGALADHRAALLLSSRDPHAVVRAHSEMARDYMALGQRARALRSSRDALVAAAGFPGHPVTWDAQLVQAEALMMAPSPVRGDVAAAAGIARACTVEAQRRQDLFGEIAARRVLARVALASNDRAGALEQLERAIELTRKYSRSSANPELQASTRASQQQLYRDYMDLQMRHPATPASQLAALRVLENTRAMNFSIRKAPSDDRNAALLDALLTRLADRHIRLAELQKHAPSDLGDVESLQLEMATLRASIDRVRATTTAGTTDPDAKEPNAWRQVREGSVQISFAMGSDRSYVWRRTHTGIEAWTLPGTAADLRKAIVNAARVDRLQSPAAYDAAILALSGKLLPPGLLPAEANLEVVADGELSLVPFAALRSPLDPSRRLAETHTLNFVPSLMGVGLPEANSARHRWHLVTVNSSSGLSGNTPANRGSALFPVLPGVSAEIDAVIAQYPGTKPTLRLEGEFATHERIRNALAEGADVMHIATHGLANLQHPLASLLALPGGTLSAGQIQEWRGRAGLVFISACETAIGPTRFAEGMPSLQRAFLRAGAANVIATLWPVEDQLAMQFARDFYSELSTGVPPADALARTQRRWLVSSAGESAQSMDRRRVAAWGYELYTR